MTMNEMTTSRPWKTAALASAAGAATLAFGMFLAVAKDSVAGDQVKVYQSDGDGDGSVKVLRVVSGDDSSPEAQAAAEAAAELDAARGGYLGVAVREDTKSDEGGAYVDNVVDGSPAEKAGLKDGDVIVAFGGDVVRGPAKLTERIRATKPGDKVAMDVRRDGKPVKLQVEMGERPKSTMWAWKSGDAAPLSDEQQLAIEDSLRGLDEKMPELKQQLGKLKIYGGPGTHRMMIFGADKPLLGVEMVETTPDLREAMGGSKDAGVLVGKVLAGSAAEKAGVKVGDLILSVDGDKVADAGDLGEAIRSREGKTVDIDLVRDKKPMHVKAALPKIDEQEDPPTGPRASAWRLPAAAFGRVAAFLAGLST
jgi:membrane-associated protease RseP (regulator of RpoE activity)